MLYRRGQPIVEFVFAATEEAIFVHAIISAKLDFTLPFTSASFLFHYLSSLVLEPAHTIVAHIDISSYESKGDALCFFN